MKVVVTGATGFIGRIVATEAARRGFGVHCLSRSSPPAGHADGAWHVFDWRQIGADLLGKLIKSISPDIIIHAAGSSSVAQSLDEPSTDFQASVGTWSTLLEAVRLSGLKPAIVFPSSAAVYGNPSALPVREDAPLHPVSPYGWHKVVCETLAQAHAQAFGASIIITRLFSVIGSTQRRLLAWELFDRLRRDDGPLKLLGTGMESRDFLHEKDVAAAMLDLAMFRQNADGGPLLVNVASGEEQTTMDLAQLLVKITAPGRKVVCCGMPRRGDPLRWCADISKLSAMLPNWRPLPLDQTIAQSLEGWSL